MDAIIIKFSLCVCLTKNRRTTAEVIKPAVRSSHKLIITLKKNIMTNPIDDRIEAKLISKIAHYRLSVRTQFRNRHHAAWPDLSYKLVMGDISNLRVWMRMAELIEPMKTNIPYTTYMAKELTL